MSWNLELSMQLYISMKSLQTMKSLHYYSQIYKLGFALHRETGQKPGVWQRKRSCFIKHVYSLLIDIFTIYYTILGLIPLDITPTRALPIRRYPRTIPHG